MNYLTFEEYQVLTQSTDDRKKLFETNLAKASAVLDNITSNFYQYNDLSADVPFRAARFKLALCSQVDYFVEIGGNTFESINKTPQTFSLGRTSISNGSRYNASGQNETKPLVSEDVYVYLEGTGLLYRG